MALFRPGRHRQITERLPKKSAGRAAVAPLAACLLVGSAVAAWSWAGPFRPLIVASGSMAPHLPVGSVVVFRETESRELSAGDVVAFREPGSGRIITHRIVDVETLMGSFLVRTKGDANRYPDRGAVAGQDVLGREALVLPYLGFLFLWAREPPGFALLVLLPGSILLAAEVAGLVRTLRRRSPEKSAGYPDRSGCEGVGA